MKTNKLKNIFLGIIAINLTLLTFIQLELFPPKTYASETTPTVTPVNTNYGLVPLNQDGSIDVNVVSDVKLMSGSSVHCYVWGKGILGNEWVKMAQP